LYVGHVVVDETIVLVIELNFALHWQQRMSVTQAKHQAEAFLSGLCNLTLILCEGEWME